MFRQLNLYKSQFADSARRIRFLGIDFDGVMTDNTVYVLEDGREAVRCARLEGFGLRRVIRAGVRPVIISTEANPVVSARAQKLGVECLQNVEDKVEAMASLLGELRLAWDEAAFIGNDINDAEVLKRVGLPVVVGDAHESLRDIGAFQTERPGGGGAVREICDAIASVLEERGVSRIVRRRS